MFLLTRWQCWSVQDFLLLGSHMLWCRCGQRLGDQIPYPLKFQWYQLCWQNQQLCTILLFTRSLTANPPVADKAVLSHCRRTPWRNPGLFSGECCMWCLCFHPSHNSMGPLVSLGQFGRYFIHYFPPPMHFGGCCIWVGMRFPPISWNTRDFS